MFVKRLSLTNVHGLQVLPFGVMKCEKGAKIGRDSGLGERRGESRCHLADLDNAQTKNVFRTYSTKVRSDTPV